MPPPFLWCGGPFLKSIFHNRLFLPIGHFGWFKVHLSNGKEEKDGSASHPLWNNSCVYYLTLLMSAKVDWNVSLYLDDNVYAESALNLWCGLLPVAYLWGPPQGRCHIPAVVKGEHLVPSHPVFLLSTIVLEPRMCKKHTETTLVCWSFCSELTVHVSPPRLTSDQKMSVRVEEEEDRAESPVSSCLSEKSERSKGDVLDFSNEPGPSGTK